MATAIQDVPPFRDSKNLCKLIDAAKEGELMRRLFGILAVLTITLGIARAQDLGKATKAGGSTRRGLRRFGP